MRLRWRGVLWSFMAALLVGWTFVHADQGTPAPPGQRADAAAAATGALTGQIVRADDGRPVRSAELTLVTPAGTTPRTAMTDISGHFAFAPVPPGRWLLRISKPGFLAMDERAARPEERAPLEVVSGRTTTMTIRLRPGAAITGRIFDEFGDPAAGIHVTAHRARVVKRQRRLTLAAADQTDDTGSFRLHTLPPGEYYVAASPRYGSSGAVSSRSLPPPLFFPGTRDVSQAHRVPLRTGETHEGLVLALPASGVVRLDGRLLDARGAAAVDAEIRLLGAVDGAAIGNSFGNFGMTHDDGTFAFLAVAPGAYVLSARIERDGGDAEFAFQPIEVRGDDVRDLVVAAVAPAVIEGRVEVEGGRPLPARFSATVVALPQHDAAQPLVAPLAADGSFRLVGAPGSYTLLVDDLTAGTVSRIEIGDDEVTDAPVSLLPNARVAARIVMSLGPTLVGGTVTSERGPAANAGVVLFASDLPHSPARRLRIVMADTTGRFTATGLPPGDYHAIALEGLEATDHMDGDDLRRLRAVATPFSVRATGEMTTVNLSLRSR